MPRGLRLLIVAVITAVSLSALVSAPFAVSTPNPVLHHTAVGIYAAGSFVCHQRSDRSFHIHNAKLPVCARCFGLYASGVLGVLAWVVLAGARQQPATRVTRLQPTTWRWLLIAGTAPTLVSVATASVGWWDPPNLPRALLAVPLGVVVGMIVTAVAAGDLR